jgi:hypothetical protein
VNYLESSRLVLNLKVIFGTKSELSQEFKDKKWAFMKIRKEVAPC